MPPTANKLTLHWKTNMVQSEKMGENSPKREKQREEGEEDSGDHVRTGDEKGEDSGKSGSE